MRGHAEHLKVPLSEAGMPGSNVASSTPALTGSAPGTSTRERFSATHLGTADPPAAGFAQLNRADRHGPPHQVLEGPAHQRDVVSSIHRAREAGQEIRERLSALPLSRRGLEHGAARTKPSATGGRVVFRTKLR